LGADLSKDLADIYDLGRSFGFFPLKTGWQILAGGHQRG
jgi:hypothetical protein